MMGTMFSNILIYEDDRQKYFYPLHYLRGLFEVKVGMLSFLERIHLCFPRTKIHLYARDYLKSILTQRYPRFFINTINVGLKALLVNGRVVMTKALKERLREMKGQQFLVLNQSQVICLYLEGEMLNDFLAAASDKRFNDEFIIQYFRKRQDVKIMYMSDVLRVETIWDAITHNGFLIGQDFQLLNKGGLILTDVHTTTKLTNEEQIYIGKHTKVDPFVHIDASKGPVYIGEKVEIKSQVLIEGPVFIDDHCRIHPGYIRENTSLFEGCRVGGEVEGSIFLEYTNKYHAGFIGHTYAGSWVNFGAMTTTSDLKNNYHAIKVQIGPREVIDTKSQFLGSIIGDHTKFGIGTLLNTGSVVGLGCNIVNSIGVLPKYIESFAWGNGTDNRTYQFAPFMETVGTVYRRRGKNLFLQDKNLLTQVYEYTTES